MRIDLNVDGFNDRVRLYVNPSLAGEPEAADVDFSDRDAVATLSELTRIRGLGGGSSGGFVASQAGYDEIRIGKSYGDVALAIPEPTSTLLIACGGLLLSSRRRG